MLVVVLTYLLYTWSFVNAGFYSKGPVKEVNSKTFKSTVLDTDHISIVEFYAPWCGHCKNLKPEYTKAAKQLDGLVNVVAIDCDDDSNKQLCARYEVKGFPTVKIFRPLRVDDQDKTKSKKAKKSKKGHPEVEDYQGPRTAKAIVDHALSRMRNYVTTITTKNVDKFVQEDGKAKVVLLSKKNKNSNNKLGGVPPLFKALAIEFMDPVFGYVAPENVNKLSSKFGVQEKDESVLLVYPAGSEEPLVYDGTMKKEGIAEFITKSLKEIPRKKERTPESTTESTTESTPKATTERESQQIPELVFESDTESEGGPETDWDDSDYLTDSDSENEKQQDSDTTNSDFEEDDIPDKVSNPWKRVLSFEELQKECVLSPAKCAVLATSAYGQLPDFQNINTARVQLPASIRNELKFIYFIDIDDELEYVAKELKFAPYIPQLIPSKNNGPARWSHAGAFAIIDGHEKIISNMDNKVLLENVLPFITNTMNGKNDDAKRSLPNRYSFDMHQTKPKDEL